MTTAPNLNWIRQEIEDSTFLLYDGTCRTGGLLPVAEDLLQKIADERRKQVPPTSSARRSTPRPTRFAKPNSC